MRGNQEWREALKVMAGELGSRLEAKSAELLRQVAQEHQERVRAQEALFGQVDLRAKILEEKVLYEKEEARERHLTLEGQMRAEQRRREESLQQLTEDMERLALRTEKQVEFYRTEVHKAQANFEEQIFGKTIALDSELAILKRAISGECEKIGEIIREEVGARFNSDVLAK